MRERLIIPSHPQRDKSAELAESSAAGGREARGRLEGRCGLLAPGLRSRGLNGCLGGGFLVAARHFVGLGAHGGLLFLASALVVLVQELLEGGRVVVVVVDGVAAAAVEVAEAAGGLKHGHARALIRRESRVFREDWSKAPSLV